MSIASAATGAEQRVIDHLATHFGLKADAVQILSLTPRDLPQGAAEFFVELKDTHGHDNYNYVVIGDKVYCSRVEGEFARLLREQSLLDRKDLTAAQYMRLYSLFALPRQVKYIDANVLQRNAASYRAFPQVKAPSLAPRPDGGITLTFFATPVQAVQPSKWIVSVSRGYEVDVTSEAVGSR